jgi:hypothetical protein
MLTQINLIQGNNGEDAGGLMGGCRASLSTGIQGQSGPESHQLIKEAKNLVSKAYRTIRRDTEANQLKSHCHLNIYTLNMKLFQKLESYILSSNRTCDLCKSIKA